MSEGLRNISLQVEPAIYDDWKLTKAKARAVFECGLRYPALKEELVKVTAVITDQESRHAAEIDKHLKIEQHLKEYWEKAEKQSEALAIENATLKQELNDLKERLKAS